MLRIVCSGYVWWFIGGWVELGRGTSIFVENLEFELNAGQLKHIWLLQQLS